MYDILALGLDKEMCVLVPFIPFDVSFNMLAFSRKGGRAHWASAREGPGGSAAVHAPPPAAGGWNVTVLQYIPGVEVE